MSCAMRRLRLVFELRMTRISCFAGAYGRGRLLVTRLMTALKGRDIPAQGNALGNEAKTDEP